MKAPEIQVDERIGISVIVCCYNSVSRLGASLSHLAKQKLEGRIPVEIIVVDNNSDDNTANFAKEQWYLLNGRFPLKVLREEKPGLSHARRLGVQVARFSFIIFCDDDNWLSQSYFQRAFDLLSNNIQIGVCGGWNEPVALVPIPDWFIADGELFAIGKAFPKTRKLVAGEFVWGAGMVARKTVLQKVFDAQYPFLCDDRKGAILTGGGDAEMCFRCQLMGYEVWFIEDLKFQHFTPAARLTKEYRQAIWEGLPINAYNFQKYNKFFKILAMSWFQRSYNAAVNSIKYLLSLVLKSAHLKNWSGDNLYFILKGKAFKSNERNSIYGFYKRYCNRLESKADLDFLK